MPRLQALTNTPPRAVIYLRQSTYRDESISLELQEIACRDYADRMGYDVVGVESDPGISGRTWKRPAVQRTMQMVDDGEADVVVLWKWSRLSRSRKDWALAIDRCDIAGGKIESATEPIDTATASGRFARGVMTEYAAFQSEQIGETWEEVRQRRLSRGLPASGRLPFGWRWVKPGGIEAHPDQAPIVVEMYRRYLAGDGASTIAQWLNSQHIPAPNGAAWARARPLTVLDSPIHAGMIPYRGQTYVGAHEPIVDRSIYDAYLAERAARRDSGAKPREYAHLLSTLVRCECGGHMHGKGSVTGGQWYGGYLCGSRLNNHSGRAYVSAKRLDPAIVNWMQTFDLDAAASPGDMVDVTKRDRLLREVSALENELGALARQHARDVIPEVAYMRATAEIQAEIADRNLDLRRIDDAKRSRPDPETVYRMRDDWEFWDTAAQNRGLRALIQRVDIVEDAAKARITTTWGDSFNMSL